MAQIILDHGVLAPAWHKRTRQGHTGRLPHRSNSEAGRIAPLGLHPQMRRDREPEG